MTSNKARSYRRWIKMTSGALRSNPVLVRGLALPLAVIPSVTLKNGLAMSLVMVCTTLPPVLLARLLGRKLPSWLRMPVYSMVSMVCLLGGMTALSGYPALLDGLGIYLPLAAVNTVMSASALEGHRRSLGHALYEAAMSCVGFAAVVCSISALREILVSQTLWGIPVALYPIKIDGAALPFFGFILLGFGAALFRAVDRILIRMMLAADKPAVKEVVQ